MLYDVQLVSCDNPALMMDKDTDTMVATATVTSDDWGPEKVLSVYDPAHR
jgi:hypothetical protein